jgi:hypothetical protein
MRLHRGLPSGAVSYAEHTSHKRIRNSSKAELSEKCAAAIHASCAQGMPGTVLNNMARGIIPLVSRESGIDTDGLGVVFEECSVSGIRGAVTDFANMPVPRHGERIYKTAATR